MCHVDSFGVPCVYVCPPCMSSQRVYKHWPEIYEGRHMHTHNTCLCAVTTTWLAKWRSRIAMSLQLHRTHLCCLLGKGSLQLWCHELVTWRGLATGCFWRALP